jgi:hypothetical protein
VLEYKSSECSECLFLFYFILFWQHVLLLGAGQAYIAAALAMPYRVIGADIKQ